MVEQGVETLQHRLRGKIELIQQDPTPFLHRGEHRPVLPGKHRANVSSSLILNGPRGGSGRRENGQISAEEVGHVRLLA
jgi:hypothetical protein